MLYSRSPWPVIPYTSECICPSQALSPSLPFYLSSLATISLYEILNFFFFCFLGLHHWHVEVPKLGVELELQLPPYPTATATQELSCICDLHRSSRQCQILNSLSGPGIEPESLWILVGFVTTEPQQELLKP